MDWGGWRWLQCE
ncbi:hypothetical protein Zm00014a_028948 [Zea mays]|uniref:Uncharacterized protein n=1 Tax=Zea mays TaxID=4577 RepID=A0A3L6DVH1_MAIZE|nr:hypothetical protein Zm00014a_028948 [Zea mays]